MNTRLQFYVLALVLGLTGCSSKKSPAGTELAAIKEYAKAEVTIERLRKQAEPDWDAITAQYEITSAIVKKYDAKLGTLYDSEIREALARCAAADKAKVNQQILAKGLQHVTVLAITDELDTMGQANAAERKIAAERIAAYFEGIRPTFTRRDKDFFGENKTLETAADTALLRFLKADSAALLTARRELEDVIVRTYALSVLYEIMEIERLRDSDRDECDIKRKEAEIFYRIISPRIKRHSPRADEMIANMLSSSYDTMNAQDLQRYLKDGLTGITLR